MSWQLNEQTEYKLIKENEIKFVDKWNPFKNLKLEERGEKTGVVNIDSTLFIVFSRKEKSVVAQ